MMITVGVATPSTANSVPVQVWNTKIVCCSRLQFFLSLAYIGGAAYTTLIFVNQIKTEGICQFFCFKSVHHNIIYNYRFKGMGGERMAKSVYESDVRGVRRRGRARKCWLDKVKEVLARKGINIQEAKVSV